MPQRNMAVLIILHLLVGLTTLYAKSLPPKTLYDALVKNCPTINVTDNVFKNQDIFHKCKSWQEITETKNLSDATEQNVLCLLYYDSFISLCTEISTKKVTDVTINLVPDLKENKIDNVCKNLALFPPNKTFEHNVNKIISKDSFCYKICANYDGTLVRECSLAYYFANYILTTASPSLTGSLEVKEQKAVPAENNIEPESNSPNVNPISNNEPIVQPANEVKTKNSAVTPSSVTENKVATASPGNVIDELSVAHPNLEVSNDNPPNVNPPKHEEKPPTKEEMQPIVPKLSESQPVEGISEQNAQETIPETGQQKNDDTNKGETDIEVEQPMIDVDQNMEDEEANDGNYKDEEDKPINGNEGEKKNEKPSTLTSAGEMPANYNTAEELDGESYFFSYFMVICVLFVLGYVGYHNRQKVMALMLEGKRGKRQGRGRRPNSANYHKLDSNLEEAISSTCTKNSSHVIY